MKKCSSEMHQFELTDPVGTCVNREAAIEMYLNSYFLLWQIESQCQGHDVLCITKDITYLSILFVPHTRFYR